MKNKGAITVFLLLITTVVFCLMGFLIDGTRILLADYMVDNASLTALRSTKQVLCVVRSTRKRLPV